MQQILSLQTKLVKIIEKNHAQCQTINCFSVPTTKLISQWEEMLEKWKKESSNIEFFDKQNIDFNELVIKNLVEVEYEQSLCQFFSIGAKTSIIFPHLFYNFLNVKFQSDESKIKTEIQEIITRHSTYCLIKKLLPHISKQDLILEFSMKGTEQYDCALFFDNNKLFLFKIFDLDFVDDVESTCTNLFNDFKKIEKNIVNGTTFYSKDKVINALPHTNIEIIPIILFRTIKMNVKISLSDQECFKSKHFWIGFYADFLSILDELNDFMRFLKFLRREKTLRDRLLISTSSELDLLAYYLQNNDSFLQSGNIPHIILPISGCWDDFKAEQIKKRPDFQARYEESEEDDTWDLKVISDSLFFVRNIVDGFAANVFLLPSKRDIWIMAMNEDIQYDENEVHCIRSLTELIPYRFINNNIFDNFLRCLDIPYNTKIRFSLMSTKMIKEQNIERMYQFLPLIIDSSPIIVKHLITPKGIVIFYLIYSIDYFLSLLNTKPLEIEKYVIKQILNEICIYAKIKNSKEISSKYLNDLFQNASSAFTITDISSHVYTPTSQTNYPITLQSDRSEVTRMIAEFLTTLQISPGVYDEDDAKCILNKIYDFLNTKFIARISKIKQFDLLSFLSHCDGQIIKERKLEQERSKHDSQFEMEYDPIERFSKKNSELNLLNAAYRHSIEIAVKHGSEDSKILTMEDWLELQAISEQIINCSYSSSYLFYRLGEYQFRIFKDYSFIVKQKDVTSLKNFATNFSRFISSSKKPTVNYHTTESATQYRNEFDTPFENEFGITLHKFYNIVNICIEYMNQEKKETKCITIDELYNYGNSINSGISKQHLEIGLNILSITRENMDYNFYPSDSRNRKYRYRCKPIIKFPDNKHYLINSWSLDNVIERFTIEIDQGYLLYNDKFINSELLTHLKSLREKANKHHEKEVYQLFKTKTNFCELNIKKENKMLNDIDEELPGEIDTLAIFEDTKEIYLIESKNTKMNYTARDISNEIKKFTKTNGYIDKFVRKIQFIKKHLPKILEHYGIFNSSDWKINSYFVTSYVSFPQQHSVEFRFITLTELKNRMSHY